jgi:hypothetical protein
LKIDKSNVSSKEITDFKGVSSAAISCAKTLVEQNTFEIIKLNIKCNEIIYGLIMTQERDLRSIYFTV